MIAYLYSKFIRVATGVNDDENNFVLEGYWPQADLVQRLDVALEALDPNYVHILGPTNRERIEMYRALPRDDPRVARMLNLFQWLIDDGRLNADGSMTGGDASEVLGAFY